MTKRTEKKCRCGQNRKIFCSRCSKVRMVILLKNGNEHLQINGYNPVWYSALKYNTTDPYKIIEKMKDRFYKHPIARETNVIQFYLNHNRLAPLHTEKL